MVLILILLVVGAVVTARYFHNKAHAATDTSHEMIGISGDGIYW